MGVNAKNWESIAKFLTLPELRKGDALPFLKKIAKVGGILKSQAVSNLFRG